MGKGRRQAQEGQRVCRDSFERAKIIGRRNTFFDGITMILFNRDNELMDIVVKLAAYLVINMGVAMFLMFWLFVAKLPHLIWSFGATWVRPAPTPPAASCRTDTPPLYLACSSRAACMRAPAACFWDERGHGRAVRERHLLSARTIAAMCIATKRLSLRYAICITPLLKLHT